MGIPALTTLRFARVALTGRFGLIPREQIKQLLAEERAELVASPSKRTSVLVVGSLGWPLLADGHITGKLRRAEELNAAGARIRIISERELLRLAGRLRVAESRSAGYTREDTCRMLGIEPETLLLWLRLGLVESNDGVFDFQDLVSLRTVCELIQSGADPATINSSLAKLRRLLPGVDRPLAQLGILRDKSELIAQVGGSLLSPTGQFLLDFEAAPDADDPIALTPAESDFAARAEQLESQDRLEEAAEAYRQAIEQDPQSADLHFNLANVLRDLSQGDASMRGFRRAAELDPAFGEAWYNLADLQEETGDLEGARTSLERALAAIPTLADARFNLASILEQLDLPEEACDQWRRYLQLDPKGEWAVIARRQLSALVSP